MAQPSSLTYSRRYHALAWMTPFLLLGGALFTSTVLFTFGLLLMLFVFISFQYLRYQTQHVKLINPRRTQWFYENESGEFVISLENHGLLPLHAATVTCTVYNVAGAVSMDKTAHAELPVTLEPKSTNEVRIPFETVQRGVTEIRAVHMEVFDVIRAGKASLTFAAAYTNEACVYPIPAPRKGLADHLFLRPGNQSMPLSVFEDPLLKIGARDYAYGDSFRSIDWHATARQQALQTKEVERQQFQEWSLFMNVTETNSERFEQQLKEMAYLILTAVEKGVTFEFYTNLQFARGGILHHPPGQGKEHGRAALQLLARIKKNSVLSSFDRLVEHVEKSSGIKPIVFYSALEDKKPSRLTRWQQHGTNLHTFIPHPASEREAETLEKEAATI
ncbi:DUF58 domain-containing protein [Salsuginibacillus kocurii]|uniref:DUF58 domain-containing protein n=1 Tax=Salsuginibacillus kocurii TaxID=427078 RepID=UPI00036A0DE7|nr:DUF58 domain-containing protein [Salsuginibacillus kocurii]